MIKRCIFILGLVILSAAFVYQPVMAAVAQTASEDTAQIRLKKTAVSSKKLYTYTVKKGDTLSSIARSVPGITEADISNNYQLIRELNPRVHNLDNLNVGQQIVLPGKPVTETSESKVESATESAEQTSVANVPSSQKTSYRIKRGDTLFKIIRREMKVVKADIPQTLKLVKSINPSIKNVNKIYAGAVIKLPGGTVFVKTPEEIKSFAPEKATALAKPEPTAKIIEVKEKKVMPPEARLAVLKQVITQMNGSITTTGNYYLPIPKAGQVTIDCSKIPLVEFDDNTVVFVDLENIAHNNLKKMISDNWANYYLVKVEKDDDVIAILRKIINSTKNYNVVKGEKSLIVGTNPQVNVALDWIIMRNAQPIQGLRKIYENNLLLPKSIKNYAQKNGVTITEISDETGIVGKPEEVYALPPIPVFPSTSAKDFTFALVSYLGYTAEKDVDVQIFDTVKDGFNLSIKADVTLSKDNKKYIIYSQSLSQQFIYALKQAGNEPIFVSDLDSPKNIMENVLRGLGVPFSHGSFTFSGLEKNQAPFDLKFTATKINQSLYVVDFDMDQELRGLLKEIWSADIARY